MKDDKEVTGASGWKTLWQIFLLLAGGAAAMVVLTKGVDLLFKR